MMNLLQSHEIIKTDFVKAENCYIYDRDGRQFTDFESGIWCTALGHCHPRINSVINNQIKKVHHLGTRYPHFLAQEAAQAILDIVGLADGKCTFLSSGSEAVEFGVQIARRVAPKPQFLTFSNCYLGAYGSAGSRGPDEWVSFDWSACGKSDPYDCLDAISFDSIGAFVLEPGGSGSGFVKFPPKTLVEEIAYRVKQQDGIIVINEVTTGIGRTGKWFGFQHYDIQPDIVAIGKGIGNGYPVSSVAMKQYIAEKLEEKNFYYAQSHQNDPLGCAVAKEVITAIKVENHLARVNSLGTFFLEGLKELEKKFDVIKNARGRGLILALEFHPDDRITATWAYHALLAKGFLVGYYPDGNILRFDPALTVEKKDIERLLASIEAILADANS